MEQSKYVTYDQFQAVVERFVTGRREEPVLFLENQQMQHNEGNREEISLLAVGAKIELSTRDEEVSIRSDRGEEVTRGDPWDALFRIRREYPGWYVGWLGYDLKNSIEDLKSANEDPVGAPDLWFVQPRLLLRYGHQSGLLTAIYGDLPSEEWLLAEPNRSCESECQVGPLEADLDRETYRDHILRIQEGIREGEYYEVNLSHILRARFNGEPWALYRKMREAGPVPFAAWIDTGELAICCASPERFLKKSGRLVFSQPIKGTAPRSSDPVRDRKLKEELENSEKERAENLMIVDLVRHDLSRTAIPGSVRVSKLFDIQSYATVHQLVSTVEAEVSEGRSAEEVLKCCFPPGSMTGAPKIRVMKEIEEVETYRRGVYSGAIGYLTPEDDFDFNVVIRTAIISGEELSYPVGGAITSDSDPDAEWEETWVKARALSQTGSGEKRES
ncbi:MAG: aminodeoxychorismate synthase component I [Balneolaceae bacterium]